MVTTVVAAMGRKVISVDPMKEHLSYIRKSLGLLGNQDNVMLLNNVLRQIQRLDNILYVYALSA